jgi:hypothetical protein
VQEFHLTSSFYDLKVLLVLLRMLLIKSKMCRKICTMSNEQPPAIEATEQDLHSYLWAKLVYDEQSRQADSHTGRNSPFASLPFNPRDIDNGNSDGHPGQLLDDYCIEPDMTPDMEPFIEMQGEEFQNGFTDIVDSFYKNKELIGDINHKLSLGDNIVVITNHGEIYDIAIIQAALRVALARDAIDQNQDPLTADRFNLIVHRMISQLGVPDKNNPQNQPAPALSILRLVGQTYLSFARTENSKKAQIPSALDKKCNELMLESLGNKMAHGGQILAFAPSGSKDESIRDRFGKWLKVIKPVNAGTYRLMRQDKAWILAVGVALDHESGPVCSVSELIKCESNEECHQLLESIAEHHTRLTGIKTFYARKQADLDAWREEAVETVHEVTVDPERRNKILIPAATFVAGALAGFIIGRKSRNRKDNQN